MTEDNGNGKGLERELELQQMDRTTGDLDKLMIEWKRDGIPNRIIFSAVARTLGQAEAAMVAIEGHEQSLITDASDAMKWHSAEKTLAALAGGSQATHAVQGTA